MTMPEHKYHFVVPMDEFGAEQFEKGIEEVGHIVFIELSEAENDSLFDVYGELNRKLGIVIDAFEEERITVDKAKDALTVVQNRMRSSDETVQRIALDKLKQALDSAIACDTYVEIVL